MIKKHVELQTNLRDLEDEAGKTEDEKNHIAKTIKILEPDYPVEELKPKCKRLRRIHTETGNSKRHIRAFVANQSGTFTSGYVKHALLVQGIVQTKKADTTYPTPRIAIHPKQMASLSIIKQIDRLKHNNAILWRQAC